MKTTNQNASNSTNNQKVLEKFTKPVLSGITASIILGFIGVPPNISSKFGIGITTILMKSEGIYNGGNNNEKNAAKSK